jgi:hypothetical protein
MKPELKVERFLDQAVCGGVVFVGGWYLHRRFLFEYFPSMAGDRSGLGSQALEAELAIIMALLSAVALGVMLSHVADIALVACFDEHAAGKRNRAYLASFRTTSRPFTLGARTDPRVDAIGRYLSSPRANQFSAMLREWAMTTPGALQNREEAVVAHQHIVAHLRTLNSDAKAAVEQLYEQVMFAATLFLSLVVLFFVGLASFFTAAFVDVSLRGTMVRIVATLLIYGAAVVAGISLRRKFREFSHSVLTLGLHFFVAMSATSTSASDRQATSLPFR